MMANGWHSKDYPPRRLRQTATGRWSAWRPYLRQCRLEQRLIELVKMTRLADQWLTLRQASENSSAPAVVASSEGAGADRLDSIKVPAE
jgi:hypothetical protein